MRLKHKIQNLIDSEKITDLKNSSTKKISFLNYLNIPPLAAIVINSGISKEKSLDAFKNEKKNKKPTALSYLPREIEKEMIEEVTEEIQD